MEALPPGIEDPYVVLNIRDSNPEEITSKGITKKYHELAKIHHPDKYRGDEAGKVKAQEIFVRIKTAYDFLMDDSKRGAFDKARAKTRAAEQQRAKRDKEMDSSRLAMKRSLEEREKLAKKMKQGDVSQTSNKAAEEANRNRLRREGKERREGQTAEDAKRVDEARRRAAKTAEASAAQRAASQARVSTTRTQIKVKWRRREQSHSDETLVSLFRRFGYVIEVEMSDKGNSALVTFDSEHSAKLAFDAYESSDTMRLSIVGVPRSDLASEGGTISTARKTCPGASLASARDMEDLDAMRLRQGAERARLQAALASGTHDPSRSSSKGVEHEGQRVMRYVPISHEELTAKEERVFAFLLSQEA